MSSGLMFNNWREMAIAFLLFALFATLTPWWLIAIPGLFVWFLGCVLAGWWIGEKLDE